MTIKAINLTGRHLIAADRDMSLMISNQSEFDAFIYTSTKGNQGWIMPPGSHFTVPAYNGKLNNAKQLWVRYTAPELPLRSLDSFTNYELLEELLQRQGDC